MPPGSTGVRLAAGDAFAGVVRPTLAALAARESLRREEVPRPLRKPSKPSPAFPSPAQPFLPDNQVFLDYSKTLP